MNNNEGVHEGLIETLPYFRYLKLKLIYLTEIYLREDQITTYIE